MKTPREVLLDRHRQTNARLDAIRSEVVHAMGEQPEKAMPRKANDIGFLATCWQELFVSCRRSWTGLGVAWALLALFAVTGGFRHNGTSVGTEATPPMRQAMESQRQLRDELLGEAVVRQARGARPDSRPRSNYFREERYV